MNIVSNEKLIRRNARLAQIALLGGLVISGVGIYVSFTQPERVGALFGALIIGLTLSQIGIYFTNRWGRRPRPDEQIDQALKGLDKSYTLYHYHTPAEHLLIGPAGIWVIVPLYQRGQIVYEKGRWRQKGGGLWLLYGKIFSQEGLGRPNIVAQSEVEAVEQQLSAKLPEMKRPPTRAVLVFTSPEAYLEVENAPLPAMKIEKLKSFIRKQAKETRLSAEKVQAIQECLT